MVIANFHTILNTVPCIGTGEERVWGNVGEDRKDGFVWELKNCENGMG